MSGALRPALDGRLRGYASRSRALELPASGRVIDLLAGCATNLVFSNAEQRLCQRRTDLTAWGGRLAAKLAVCDLLGVAAWPALAGHRDIGLSQLEILPESHGLCGDSASCYKSHPPRVQLGHQWAALAPSGTYLLVSISHTSRLAIALAVASGEPLAEGR